MIGERIKLRRMKLKLTQEQVGKIVGVTKTSVSQWEKGDYEPKSLMKLAKALKCTPEWLETGKGDEELARSNVVTLPNVSTGPEIKGNYPLISWVQAGEWSSIVELPIDDITYYPCPVACSEQTFVLRVRGVSMEPVFSENELIFIDPARSPENGQYIIARLDDENEATFKQLVVEGNHKFLKPANPNWPEQLIAINGNCTIIGVVVFAGRVF